MSRQGHKIPNYERHPGLIWLEENRAEVEEHYLGEWVAVSETGIVAHRPDIGALMRQIAQDRIDHLDIAIAFISTWSSEVE